MKLKVLLILLHPNSIWINLSFPVMLIGIDAVFTFFDLLLCFLFQTFNKYKDFIYLIIVFELLRIQTEKVKFIKESAQSVQNF